MPIATVCSCGGNIQAPDGLAGRAIKCPKCKASVMVPGTPIQAPSRNDGARLNQNMTVRPSAASPPGTAGGVFRQDGEISPALMDRVKMQVGAGESIVWVGRPNAAIYLSRSILGLVCGCLIIAVGLYFAFTFAPAVALVAVIGVLWVAISTYSWKSAEWTAYVLTNKRAIVLTNGPLGPGTRSYDPQAVAQMKRIDAPGRSNCGDLVFRTLVLITEHYNDPNKIFKKTGETRSEQHMGFIGIENISQVEQLVRQTLING